MKNRLFYHIRGLGAAPIHWTKAIVSNRSLLKGFLAREIHSRFAGSIGGALWLIVIPLSQILIYSFVFDVVLKLRLSPDKVGTESFVIFLLAGLFPWLAFSEGLTRCTNIIIDNANIVTKVVFPVEFLPISALCTAFVLNGFGFVLFLGYLIFAGFASWMWLWLPVIIVLFFLFALGLAAFLSAICVFLRDTQQIFSIVIFVWFYLTPILYPISMVPIGFRDYLKFNPAFSFIELFRQILLCKSIEPDLLCLAIIWATVSFFPGIFFFERIKPSFADVL